MDQKHILWPAIIIIVLVAAGALYYAMNLTRTSTPAPAPAPPTTVSETAELDRAAAQNDQDLSELERMQSDFESVDASQDNLGL